MIRSFVVNGGSSITSSVGIRGLLAKILTITAIFSFALAAKGVGFNVGSTIQGVVMVFTLAETYSIIGNVNSAITGKAKVEFDAVAYMLQKVKDLLDSLTAK